MRSLPQTYRTARPFAGAGAMVRPGGERLGRRLLGPIDVSRRKRAP